MQDPMELWIKKAATDSDWDVIYVNISSCCSSPSLLAWFDLLSRLRFLFTITHSCLIASCSANRVHCISSCRWQQKKAPSLTLILSRFFRSIFASCLLYTSLLFKVPCKVQYSAALCDSFYFACFHLLILSALRRASADGKETFFTSCNFTFTTILLRFCFIQLHDNSTLFWTSDRLQFVMLWPPCLDEKIWLGAS